jgi:hypothetical protein
MIRVRRGLLAIAVAGSACATTPARLPPVEELIRPDARPTAVRTGDLNGDGVVEVVAASVTPSEDVGVPHLELFARRDGEWVRVFDARRGAPPGPPETPRRMLGPESGFTSQSVPVLELVDFARDDRPDVVAAVASAGATVGPLELWVLSMGRDGSLRTAFYEATARGGRVAASADRVSFEVPVYRARDPGCCPSLIEHQTIGLDRATGRIAVIKRSRQRL